MADAKDGDGRPGAGQGLRGVRICGLPPGAAALVLLLAVLAAVGWSNTLHEQRLVGWQKSMIEGTASAPDQYRVLTPWLTDSIFRCTAPQTIDEALQTLRHVYLAVHALAFAITGFCFMAFCRRWLALPEALLGFALLMAICAVANLRGQIQVTDPLNLMFVIVGLWAIQQERIGLLFVAMVLGALNRESVLVLAGYYLLMQWPGPRRRVLTTTVLLAVAWGVTYGALRVVYGHRAYSVDVVMLGYNLAGFWHWAPPLLLLGPPALAAFQRPLDRWPGPLRRASLIIPPYLLLHLVVARLEEVRLFVPLLPVLIPLAVLGLTPAHEADE